MEQKQIIQVSDLPRGVSSKYCKDKRIPVCLINKVDTY